MSAKRISHGELKRLKRLMRIAQEEIAALYRTKLLIGGMFPPQTGLGVNVNYCVDNNLPAVHLLRLQGVKVGKR